MAREGRVEGVRGAGVGADGLHPDADHRRLLGHPSGALRAHAGRVRAGLVGVEERPPGAERGRPTRCGSSSQPPSGAARARPPMLRTWSTSSRKSGSAAAAAATSITTAGRDQPRRRDRRHVVPVLAGDPVVRARRSGCRCARRCGSCSSTTPAPLVVAADLLKLEPRGLPERLGQLEDRGALGQRRGQVDDLDATRGEGLNQGVEQRHGGSSCTRTGPCDRRPSIVRLGSYRGRGCGSPRSNESPRGARTPRRTPTLVPPTVASRPRFPDDEPSVRVYVADLTGVPQMVGTRCGRNVG